MIGIDIERNDRFLGWDEKKLKRIFTPAEIEYALKQGNPARHFCGFFCVKEALVKALNNQSIEYKKIEILHTDTNKPYIKISSYVQSLLNNEKLNKNFKISPKNSEKPSENTTKSKNSTIDISISHTDAYSTAVVQIL